MVEGAAVPTLALPSLALVTACILVAAPVAQGYSEALAKKLVLVSDAAYCGDAEHGGTIGITQWACAPCSSGAPLSNVSVFVNASRATLGFAGVTDGWTEGQHIVVAFRGSVDRLNFVDDNDVVPLASPSGRAGFVSRGIYRAFSSLKEGMLQQVHGLLHGFPDARGVLVTGHSLGAALAVHAADELAAASLGRKVVSYTFGTPRMGDLTFVRRLAATRNLEMWPVAHRADTVPECGIPGNPSCQISDTEIERIATSACPDCLQILRERRERAAYHGLTRGVWYPGDLAAAGPSGYLHCEGEDPRCENSVPPSMLNWDDHQLYLGHPMHCCAGADNDALSWLRWGLGDRCADPFRKSSESTLLYA